MPTNDVAYIGEISMFAFTFSPKGWLSCNGGLVEISQHAAMYSLLGNKFGGDGRVTFGLPNMNSRAPAGRYAGGSTLGLKQYEIGQTDGAQEVTLTTSNLPSHTHLATFNPTFTQAEAFLDVYESGADKATPSPGDLIAASGDARFRSPGGFGEPAKVALGGISTKEGTFSGTVTVKPTGGSVPIDIQSPVLAINFSICVNGQFPDRS